MFFFRFSSGQPAAPSSGARGPVPAGSGARQTKFHSWIESRRVRRNPRQSVWPIVGRECRSGFQERPLRRRHRRGVAYRSTKHNGIIKMSALLMPPIVKSNELTQLRFNCGQGYYFSIKSRFVVRLSARIQAWVMWQRRCSPEFISDGNARLATLLRATLWREIYARGGTTPFR